MSQTVLKTQNIKNDVLQMSESYTPIGERTVHIRFIPGNSTKLNDAISFCTDSFNIYSPRALTVEGTVFKSLEVYYLIQPIWSENTYNKIPNQSVDNAFQFLSNLELYHLEVGDSPWVDVKFYFKPRFVIHSSSITKLNLSDINGGRTYLVVELSLMDGEVHFCSESKGGKNRIVLISSGRYTLEPDQVYSALRKYARVTATPKSISNTIINNL